MNPDITPADNSSADEAMRLAIAMQDPGLVSYAQSLRDKPASAEVCPTCDLASDPMVVWGIEDTGNHLWVGPMRRDEIKVAEVVCHFDLTDVKEEFIARYRSYANLIVQSINHAGPQGAAIRQAENERDELRRKLTAALRAQKQAEERLAEVEKERDEAESKVLWLDKANKDLIQVGIIHDSETTNLRTDLAAAQADVKRLDWLAGTVNTDLLHPNEWVILPADLAELGRNKDIRAAIDAAQALQPPPAPGDNPETI